MNDMFLLRILTTQAWQIAVLTVIVGVAVRLFASQHPRAAHLLWLIVVVKCVTSPVWGHSLGLFSWVKDPLSWIEATGGSSTQVEVTRPTGIPDGTLEFAQERMAAILRWLPLLSWILLFGIIISVVLVTFRFVRCLRRIRAHCVTEFDEEISDLVATLAQQLKLQRVPRVIVSDVRFGPAVLGVLRHAVVLPRCLVADPECRDPKVLRPILAHELLHIRHGDLWTGTLQAAVQCMWWFHPAVWCANRLLSRETERCCDEQVVAELNCPPVEYARSLLSVIECKQSLQPVPVSPGMKPVEITSQRMERIMSLTQESRTRMSWWSVMAVLLFAFVVLPGAVTGQPMDEAASPEETELTGREKHETPIDVPMIFGGDILEISIAPSPKSDSKIAIPVRVGEGGEAALPEIGKLILKGISPTSAAVRIKEVLVKQRLYLDPQISVTITHRNVSLIRVVGAVNLPGDYEIRAGGALTLLNVISLAGGLSEDAGNRVVLGRQKRRGEISVSLLSIKKAKLDGDSNPVLRDGDVLVIEAKAPPVSISCKNDSVNDVLRKLASTS